MKRPLFTLISALLVFSMLSAPLASCTRRNTEDQSSDSETSRTENTTKGEQVDNETEKDTQIGDKTEDNTSQGDHTEGVDSEGVDSDRETTADSQGSTTDVTVPGGDTTEDSQKGESTTANKGGDDMTETESTYYNFSNAELIEYSNSIKNGVNYYYPNYKRETAVLENLEMSLEYGLRESGNKQVTYIKNKAGATYIKNTMDVFVRMADGSTYFASTSKTDTTSNLYRLGYYFYEARFEGQDFLNSAKVLKKKTVNLSNGLAALHDATLVSNVNGEITVKLSSDGEGTFDPYVILTDSSHTSKKDSPFTFLEITMKADSNITAGQLYLNTGANYNNTQKYKFPLIADGNYHTYTIPLYMIEGYEGNITGLRFDVDGKDGGTYSFKEMSLIIADVSSLPMGLSIARSFNAYSDKMHHTAQFSTETEISGIAAFGMLTEIGEETVSKLIVKDKNGIHYSLDGIDWASAEYVGFDIKDAGIFGYILPADNKSGSISVTLKNGVYVIEQTATPEGGIIKPSEKETNNANDFFMGQRVYTDANHDFDEFVYEAECERNPIPQKFFKIMSESSDQTAYVGYDALRGIYVFSYKYIAAGHNDYPTVKFSVRGDDKNRRIYVMAYSDSSTIVETAFMLDNYDMLIPVPSQVGKNFSEEAGERNLYNIDDPTYSEAIFPLIVKKNENSRFSMVNAYFKWGKYPLKQVSWIQFYAPYYHLSTAMTETNCITPYYTTRTSRNLSVLPDFRAMSAPPFAGVQRNSGGIHNFLKYTDADGNFITSENTKNTVGSYGPIYADVTMDYLTDDGKIKITYNHMEMPQEDENRTFYEMRYDILEDISFKDFAKDFSFYSVRSNDPKGVYTLVGYLNESNTPTVVDAKKAGDEAEYYVLGDKAPYFSYMKMTDDRANKSGYVNLAFIVAESEFIIGGERAEPRFVLADLGGTLSISLEYGEITLKKGDSIKINCILMPWGSQETVYDGSNGLAPDQNVLDVRENTIFNPLRAEAVKDCEIIDNVFVPMIKTTNGKSAIFTVKGGNDNCAVSVSGFDKLTVPRIYELIDGEWVYMKLSSSYYSYNQAVVRPYDGYGVSYDGDGKFSYSFIAEMDNGTERTFKIEAIKDFAGTWLDPDQSEIISNAVQDEHINLIVKGENLFNAAQGASGFGNTEYLISDNAVRFYADPEKSEASLYVFQSNIFETGQYLVIKYRTPNAPRTFKFFTSTFENGAKYENHHWSSSTIINDGQWHVLVIDVSEYEKVKPDKFASQNPPVQYYNTFTPSEDDGNYYVKFIRVDFFNQLLSEDTYIDVQYIGFSNDLEKIKTYNSDLAEIQFSAEDPKAYVLIPTGGEVTPPDDDTEDTTETTKPEDTEDATEITKPEDTEDTTEITKPEDTQDTTETSEPEVTEVPEEIKTEMNLVVSGEDLYNHVGTPQGAAAGFSNVEYMDGYTRFTNTSGSEGHFNVFTGNEIATGKYIVLKYRLPKNNASRVATFRFHISTVSSGIATTNNYYSSATLISDDQWHVLVIDMKKYEEERTSTNEFLLSSDGRYYAKFLKLFLFSDKSYAEGTYIDVEYVAMSDSLGTVYNCNKDMTGIQLSETNVDTPKYVIQNNPYRYLDATSNYTLADKYFCFHIDSINGSQKDANGNSYSYNSVSNKGITEKNLNATVGTSLKIGGWCPVEGGISKYVWSVDGKTWYDCTGKTSANSSGVLSAASTQMGGAYTFTEADGVIGGFASGLTIDLSEFVGQTVDVRIAGIPVGSTDMICVFTSINGVTVSEN